MSNKEELDGIHHPCKDGLDTKRKQPGNGSDDCNTQQQRKRKRENDLVSSLYKGMSFHKRISTGRPGTPHRYFDTSYDVIEEMEKTNDSSTQSTSNHGNQVLHRHLNGLCIVTAGNILERSIAFPPQKIADDDNDEDQNKNVEISKIKYLVKASKDSQSARGKMRVKKKKKKKQKHAHTNTSSKEGDGNNPAESVEGDHDGTVSPHTPLCRITLSNGKVVQLKCCVEGTVIETNHLFDDESNKIREIREPLLDGYLAVIMPTGGMFPPTKETS